MTAFVHHTLSDMRGGRQSWRVILACCVPSLAISFAAAFMF
jgi:hypothetical protein